MTSAETPSDSEPGDPPARLASAQTAPPDIWARFSEWRRWLWVALLLAACGLAHLSIGGLLISQTNHTDRNILGADQKHNMKLALMTRQDFTPDFSRGVSEPLMKMLPHRTDGVVNPLWPWAAAWLAEPDHAISGPDEVTEQDRAFFNRGRWFNLGLTCGFLLLAGLALARVFSLPATVNTVLLMSLGALLPRSVWFQPEPLYYVFFLLTWVACVFALLRNSLWIYALIGLLSGLAYLAKSSVHPLLIVFLGVSSARWLWGWVLAHWPGSGGTSQWVWRNHLFGVALLVFTHLLVAAPRLSHAREQFGSAFHSYPAYWMWFDDFEACYAWMGQYPGRSQLETLTRVSRPSFSNYAAEHSREEMWRRLRDGVVMKVNDLVNPPRTRRGTREPKPWKGVLESRGWFLGGLLLISLGAVAASARCGMRGEGRPCLHPETAWLVLFVAGAVCAYTLAYGWYSPIGRGDRFMLSLYAPLVLSLVWAGESIRRRALKRKAPPLFFMLYHGAHAVILAALLWRLLEIWRHPVFQS
jgi:hypothetical protein